PCIDLSPLNSLPSLFSFIIPNIQIPSVISFTPIDFPDVITIETDLTFPSVISFTGLPEFSPINFGPAPSFGPVGFGPAPVFGPVGFGPNPLPTLIEFGPAPPAFGPIGF